MSEKFEYKYEALGVNERKEIESIKNQYLPKDERTIKVERLRYLDKKVKNVPTVISLSLGIIGTLLFGTAMSFFLEWTSLWYVGIPFAIVGCIIAIVAYPIHLKLLKSLKEKHKEEIIKLSNELLCE